MNKKHTSLLALSAVILIGAAAALPAAAEDTAIDQRRPGAEVLETTHPQLHEAFAAVRGYEAELNYRYADGSYRAQEEDASTLDWRMRRFLHPDMMSVQGLGRLDVYQYIHFLVLHCRRHLQQAARAAGEGG